MYVIDRQPILGPTPAGQVQEDRGPTGAGHRGTGKCIGGEGVVAQRQIRRQELTEKVGSGSDLQHEVQSPRLRLPGDRGPSHPGVRTGSRRHLRPSSERYPDEAGYHQHRHQAVQPVEAVARVRSPAGRQRACLPGCALIQRLYVKRF
jgi:hypothetical protein